MHVFIHTYMQICIHKDVYMYNLFAIFQKQVFKKVPFLHIKYRHPLHSTLI